jgi:2-methylcitrate dehydratase PrpD
MPRPAVQASDSKGLTKAICSFVVETRSADIPRAALETAKLLILDTIGITLAASTLPIGKIITQYVAEASSPPSATVLGGASFRQFRRRADNQRSNP